MYRNLRIQSLVPRVPIIIMVHLHGGSIPIIVCKSHYTHSSCNMHVHHIPEYVCAIDKLHHTLVEHDG